MNVQLLGNRFLLLGPRFSNLLLSRCYAVKGMIEKKTLNFFSTRSEHK